MAASESGKSRWVICAVGILFVIARIYLRESTLLLFIVATINSIAFLYVASSIIERCFMYFKSMLVDSDLLKVVITRRCKRAYRIKIELFIAIVLSIIIYVPFFATATVNDVIAILSVVLSIIDDSIVQLVTENFQLY